MTINPFVNHFRLKHNSNWLYALIGIGASLSVHAQPTSLTAEAEPISKEQALTACAQVNTNVARLACYDKIMVAHTSEDTNLAAIPLQQKKQPVDLGKSISQSIKNRQTEIFLADGTQVKTDILADSKSNKEESEPVVDASQTTEDSQPQRVEDSTQLATQSNDQAYDDKSILGHVGVSQEDIKQYSLLSNLYDLDHNDLKGLFTVRPHQPMYLMPLWYLTEQNETPSTPSREVPDNLPDNYNHAEAKLKISLKTKVYQDLFDTNADVWFGYTQLAHWQMYNDSWSKPFRGVNFEPEVFITQPVTAELPFDGDLRLLGTGLVHQSNGESKPLSRSWNRLYAMAGLEWGRLAVLPRVWLRLPESDDDNSDISDYYGYGDVRIAYGLDNNAAINSLVRYNVATNKGTVELSYSQPVFNDMKGYVSLFHGYGESLVDYNFKHTGIGVGVVFNSWNPL